MRLIEYPWFLIPMFGVSLFNMFDGEIHTIDYIAFTIYGVLALGYTILMRRSRPNQKTDEVSI